jgi:hypothetical protein
LLVSWCAMACSDEDHGKSRRPSAEDRGGSHRSGTRWSRGRVALCAVCTVHVGTKSAGFLVEPQNQGRQFVSGLASKPLARFSPVWPQNRWRRFVSGLTSKLLGQFLPVWPENLLQWFLMVWPQNLLQRFSLVWPQNWWRRFLSIWPQNRRSVSWLSLKTKVVEGFPVWAS